MMAIDYFEFTSERRFISFVKSNYSDLFPKLVSQSQFNRRTRSLRFLLNRLREDLAYQLGVYFEQYFIIDTTPILAVGYRRDKSQSNFLDSADYGYCSARGLNYFGYNLVVLCTLSGIPYSFELVPASTDERIAADEILDTLTKKSV